MWCWANASPPSTERGNYGYRGGVDVLVRGELGKHVKKKLVDETGLGRYAEVVLQIEGDTRYLIMGVYRAVYDNKEGSLYQK